MAVHRRFVLLVALITVALGAAACGRATEDEINQALRHHTDGNAERRADRRRDRGRQRDRRGPAAGRELARCGRRMGDVSQGSRQFQTWCSGCHGPGGVGPDIRSPGSPGATVTAESLLPLVREGVGHPDRRSTGPYRTTEISDNQVADIAAYLNDQAAE